MAGRRKRAPPVKLDDGAKKLLSWNMHEDRRNEVTLEEDGNPAEPCTSLSLINNSPERLLSTCETESPSTQPGRKENYDSIDFLAPSSVDLSLVVLPVPDDDVWRALLCVFSLQVSPGQYASLDFDGCSFTLTSTASSKPAQLLLCVHKSDVDEGSTHESSRRAEEVLVEASPGGQMLDDIMWLQKKKLIALYQRTTPYNELEVGVYLLEACLSKPEFLSEGHRRMKKSCLLIQKLMEKFYSFTIPDISDDSEEESDQELERQNIEELYAYVRQTHQQEGRVLQEDVQHPALIPILRLYQNEAVNWMLQRENFKNVPSNENALHPLWTEVTTMDGIKLYYNPFSGSIIREHPAAAREWPGGILADEMGLGKTVEVLSLILCHPRKDVSKSALTLPEGKTVNFFIPPPPTEKTKKDRTMENRQTCPSFRVMILAAIKEMSTSRGVSAVGILKYVSAMYSYDMQRNHRLLKKTLDKLLSKKIVEQVKGRGLQGSFKLGVNYKDQMIRDKPTVQKLNTRSSKRLQSGGTQLRENNEDPSEAGADLNVLSKDHDYCALSKTSTPEKELQGRPANNGMPERLDTLQGSPVPDERSTESTDLRTKQDDLDLISQEMDFHDSPVFPISTSDYRFECICGGLRHPDLKDRVQCLQCHLWQHAECVNYKRESVSTTPFYCPHCLVAMNPVPTGATLIISPSSICHQWVDEINRHVRSSSLHVMVYQGVKKHGFLQPQMLAEQDVVITTYDVLRTELNYVDIPHSNSKDGRRFRNQKRYMAIPSPLVAVEWWRICLDEAQMVECTTAKAAEMALRLTGVNRWCVSGTPVQRGLEDLFGLVLFLGVDPYWVKHWWDQLLYRPYCRRNPLPLYRLIAKIMWRSAKKDVIDQIQIPEQTEDVHWLHFSPVERHFYHRQHEVCCQDALAKLRKISDWSLKLSSLDRRTVSSILYPLLRLRQACCHPQAVRGEFLPLQKSTMTMEELLTSLQKKCRTECEEAHRQLVCAFNGLAGIHIIKGEYPMAAELYRDVLRSSEEQKEKLKTDSLQRLHSTHNLLELLSAKHPGIPPTLRDDKLEEEIKELKEHYMIKSNAEVSEAHQALQPILQNIRELQRKINFSSPWWIDVIQRAIQNANDEDLVQRVQNEITVNYKHQVNKLSMADKFRDCRGLQYIVTSQMEEVRKCQKQVREAVKNLEGPPSKEVIQTASICHLRVGRLPLHICVFCKADELFTDYESKLFSHTVKGQTAIFEEMIEEENGLVDDRLPKTSRGLWAASELERSLKAILSFARTHRLDPWVTDEGACFMELFEAWKKEYKLLHEYWMVLRNHVSAIDELSMATQRLRVRLPDEPKPNPPVPHIIEPHEVEQNRVKLLNDKAVAKSQLQKKLGQLLYLTNLEKSQNQTSGGVNPEPCPICARNLGKQWAVLTCGHCFCNECVAIIIEQYSVGTRRSAIKCAICRQTTSHKEISYVFTSEAASEEKDIPVKGSHSTKVEAVVRTLMKIQTLDLGAKSLVFSTWQDVLDIIAKALQDNGMVFSQINGIQKFQENLSAFKYDPKINILLLPLHTGSNGLNIIEATHVLLVEPILNPAHELQAIGRVHRIGQKNHTSTSMKQSEASVLTVADLADLFTEERELE
ncbi:E3 ubiquitin-protein ligase SHPRH isoform X2 [Bufo gargarizans]|uniref:E3 ubiquitin-protein ligase SHPRH isoform X2 n=1 Tax=Bufo gargarizans TaxID=30331 RepID=UPI001CF311BD|nr:E3 ubiquitin-protein ligase SHPRH isoform X2 [Bufo gargarizans]